MDPYHEAIEYLKQTIQFLKKNNTNLLYHVFIHKTDSEMFSNEEKRTETFNEIKESIFQEFQYDLKDVTLEFHLTTYAAYSGSTTTRCSSASAR